jgi:ribonuclease P protein subunit RPR2
MAVKKSQEKLALERVRELFKQAESEFSSKEGKVLANRYVKLARRIAMKYRISIPSPLKRKFCKHCYSFLKPGVNSRVRLAKKRVIIACQECNKFMRLPYKK